MARLLQQAALSYNDTSSMSTSADFSALEIAWQSGQWPASLPAEARKLARRAPRLQNRLLALELAQCIDGMDREQLEAMDHALDIDAEPHHHLRFRTAGIALELGDEQRALNDLDQALRLRAQRLRHRLGSRWTTRSRWTLAACPALLDLAARERPDELTAAERARAADARWLMERLEPPGEMMSRLLERLDPAQPPGVHRLKTGRARLILMSDDGPFDARAPRAPISGARIDAADAVVRFDDTGVQAALCRTQGMRTDLWALSQAAMPPIDEPAGPLLLIAQPAFAWRPHPGWESLVRSNAVYIAHADEARTRELVTALAAPPTAALTVLSELLAVSSSPSIELVSEGHAMSLDRWRDTLARQRDAATETQHRSHREIEHELLSTLLLRQVS